MKRYLPGIIVILLSTAIYTGWTCGWGIYMPIFFIGSGSEYHLSLPNGSFYSELNQIIYPDVQSNRRKHSIHIPDGYQSDEERVNWGDSDKATNGWNNTLLSDLKDLKNALKSKGMNKSQIEEVIQTYKHLREDLYEKQNYSSLYRDVLEKKQIVDFSEYESVLESIPKEFQLYIEGAASYRANYISDSMNKWYTLLTLPEQDRQYRTTWATYMLAKSYLISNATKTERGRTTFNEDATSAIQLFHKTQELAAKGFIDTLRLSEDSEGWIAHCEYLLGDYKNALHRYIKLKQDHNSVWSSIFQMKDIPIEAQIQKDWLEDEICRRFSTAIFLSENEYGYKNKSTEKWLNALKNISVEFKPGEIERFAWIAYLSGNYDNAKEWLYDKEKLIPEGKWVKAKLLFRDGKGKEAIEILKSIIGDFNSDLLYGDQDISSEIGAFYLSQKDYIEALELFNKYGQYDYAYFILEYILTLNELDKYCNQTNKYLDSLAKRYARNDKWDKALTYFEKYYEVKKDKLGTIYYQDMIQPLESIIECLNVANDINFDNDIRGESYLKAAEILMEKGRNYLELNLEIIRYEFEDYDNTVVYNYLHTEHNPPKNVWGSLKFSEVYNVDPSDDVLLRFFSNIHKPIEENHFIEPIIQYLWKSAELFPDNDNRKAKALYLGGTYIKQIFPEESAKFYHELITRCNQLPITQEAERLGDFPPTFDVTPPETETNQNQ